MGTATLSGSRPLIGHLARMRRDPLGTLLAASRLGDVTRIHMGPRGWAFLATHPDAVKRIFLDNQANYTKQTRGFDTLRVFLGQGLLTSEGSFWRRQRRIAQPAFHHRHLQRFAAKMIAAAEDLADRWESRARRNERFDLAADMMRVTLRVVGECLFSTDPSHESSRIGPHVEVLLEHFISRTMSPVTLPLSWPLARNRMVRRAIEEMHALVDAIVAERQRSGPGEEPDLLDLLMTTEDSETGERMDAGQLRDEVLTLLIAGHETTAAALSWTFVLLAKHPEIDRRLESELAALGAAPLGLEVLERAPFVGQVIQESLRLYPPAWIVARKTMEQDELCGVRVPPGHLAITSPWATHRRPDLFVDPDRFDPDRFGAAGPAAGYSRFAYFPFGGGPRICIGNGFALMEAKLILATLRRRFRVELATSDPIEPLPLLTLRCRDGVPAVVRSLARG